MNTRLRQSHLPRQTRITDFTFGTWNVQTMLQPGKMMEIDDEVLKLGIDLVALQEIRWQGQGEINKKNFTAIRVQWTRESNKAIRDRIHNLKKN